MRVSDEQAERLKRYKGRANGHEDKIILDLLADREEAKKQIAELEVALAEMAEARDAVNGALFDTVWTAQSVRELQRIASERAAEIERMRAVIGDVVAGRLIALYGWSLQNGRMMYWGQNRDWPRDKTVGPFDTAVDAVLAIKAAKGEGDASQ